jgi:AI-2 transport protein TqsA
MPIETTSTGRFARGLGMAASLIVVVAGLKLGADLLVPVVTGAFLAIVCLPVVEWLRRRGVPTGLAVAVTLVLLLGTVLGTAVLVVDSMSQFADRLPDYQERVQGTWDGLVAWLQTHGIELASPRQREPIEVTTVIRTVGQVAGTAVNALSIVFLVFLLTAFTLAEAVGFPTKMRRAIDDPQADLGR